MLCIAALLCVTNVGLAHGQDTTTAQRDGWIIGPLLGLPGAGSQYELSLFTLGFGVTRLVPNRPGLDVAIGTMPRMIPQGFLPIGARVGPSIPLALGPDAFIIPSVGVSAIGALGTGGVAAVGGLYGGVATVLARGSVGFRSGVTLHRPLGADESIWLIEIGVMRVPMPGRAR